MKSKLTLLIILIWTVLLTAGCTSKSSEKNNVEDTEVAKEQTQEVEGTEEGNQKEEQEPKSEPERHNIGGLALGDKKEKVVELLGENYKIDDSNEYSNMEEEFYIMIYEDGTDFVIGKDSNTILQIFMKNPNFKTNLGVKVGDSGIEVREKYDHLDNVVSMHDNIPLKGWYMLDDESEGQVIIFSYEEQGLHNEVIKDDSILKGISIVHGYHLD